MKSRIWLFVPALVAGLFLPAHAASKKPLSCARLHIDAAAEQTLAVVSLPPDHECMPRMSHGYPIPDPTCTPGAINPTVTIDVLQDKKFRTTCLRDQVTSAKQKQSTYAWYGIKKPKNNTGQKQTCELDHLCSLELGCADTLANIWPQCGPDHIALKKRYFKIKDAVENYLAREVKAGRIELQDAQRGISEDWTQYLNAIK